MKKYYADSDIGSVLIGNDDWTFAVPNGYGDGTSEILVFESESEFLEFMGKKPKRMRNKKERFISSAQGTFNIYDYDCAFEHEQEKEVITTLTGRYGVYYIDNTTMVIFVKWN